MRRAAVLIVSLLTWSALSGAARADPGRLDTFFSGDGKATAFSHGATGYAVVIDKHGRILVAGYTLDHSTDLALARFDPNGSPDTSFGGGDGRVTTDLGATSYAFAVALQSGGKILVAGERDKARSSQMVLVRFTTRGVRDRTFKNHGVVFTDFGKRYQGAFAIAVTPSGDIVVGGFASNGTGSRWALARYGPNGVLDKSFGGDGRVTVDLSATDEQIEDLLIAGGRIVAVGYVERSLIPRFAIAAFTANGRLDRTFAHKGVNVVDVSNGSDIAYAVARAPNGSLAVSGYAAAGGSSDWGVVRFGPHGRLDDAFSHNGVEITKFGPGYDASYGVTVQPNGRIVAVGRGNRLSGDFCVVRYRLAGGLDKGFGGDGRTCTDFFSGDDTARDVVLQDNGKIVVAGGASSSGVPRFGVSRYLP